ncbi:CrcB family protein [Sporomusa sp. KB1]|jgi:CrcB protein|uniref:fluoride efflux transporter FluC n=1 Tax=Sporomusa sp. KB1 TaxID=943346 RepID=UPI0011AAEBEE|nr:CrcB family protein [Sporomusa sp. KB1]TWH52077.1 CrcB protein [Sporomusa sp. KB1]
MEIFIIGVGGIAGALARYSIGLIVGRHYFMTFPLATFLINITGSFLLGLSVAHIAGLPINRVIIERYGFQIGFLGAYTTHSTFAYESIRLVEDGEWKNFFNYVAGSVIVGLLCCGIGYLCGA